MRIWTWGSETEIWAGRLGGERFRMLAGGSCNNALTVDLLRPDYLPGGPFLQAHVRLATWETPLRPGGRGSSRLCVVPLTSPSITDLLARLFGGKLQLACLCPILCSLLQMCAPGCTGVQSTQDPTSKHPAFSEWCAVTFLTFRTLEQVWNKYYWTQVQLFATQKPIA